MFPGLSGVEYQPRFVEQHQGLCIFVCVCVCMQVPVHVQGRGKFVSFAQAIHLKWLIEQSHVGWTLDASISLVSILDVLCTLPGANWRVHSTLPVEWRSKLLSKCRRLDAVAIASLILCSWLNWFIFRCYFLHVSDSIIALPLPHWQIKVLSKDCILQYTNNLTVVMSGTWWSPMNCSWGSSCASIHLRHSFTWSLLLESVTSSHFDVKISIIISASMLHRAKNCSSSLWMGWSVYFRVFHCIMSRILGSSFACNRRSWWNFNTVLNHHLLYQLISNSPHW